MRTRGLYNTWSGNGWLWVHVTVRGWMEREVFCRDRSWSGFAAADGTAEVPSVRRDVTNEYVIHGNTVWIVTVLFQDSRRVGMAIGIQLNFAPILRVRLL